MDGGGSLLLKYIDNAIGSLLTQVMPRSDRWSFPESVFKVLFIRPGGLGDALLLLPAIEALSRNYPEIKIDVLAEKRNQSAYSLINLPGRVELYTDCGAFFRLRKQNYDVIIDTEQWYRLSAVYARMLKPKGLIGFASNDREKLLNCKIDYNLHDYEIESFFRLLRPLGIDEAGQGNGFTINLSQQAVQVADVLLADCRAENQIAVFPGASVPEKRWPIGYYRELVGGLRDRGVDVVVVGGNREVAVADQLVSATGCRSMAGKTSLLETAALLARMDLLITGDSSVLHLASLLGVATLSLFGPSNPEKWAPLGDEHVFLQEKFDCVPCSRFGTIPPCSSHVQCLTSLSAKNVLRCALSLLRGDEQ